MSSIPETKPAPKILFWIGWVLSVLPVLMLTMSAIMKIQKPPEVVEGFGKLGFPESLAMGLAVVELSCTVLYLIPQTSVLGAILLTGYLGGATATHVRVGDNFITPIIIGVFVWLGLYLRDRRVRALIPFKTSERKSA